MAVQIQRSPDEPGFFAKLAAPIGTILGAGIGTAVAPGAGTALGATLGGAAGAGAGALAAGDPQQNAPIALGPAMQRRNELLANNDSSKLAQGLMALQHAPEDVQQQYGPNMLKAYQKSVMV